MRGFIALAVSWHLWIALSVTAGVTIVDEAVSLSTEEKALSKDQALIKKIFKQKILFQSSSESFRPQWYELHGSLNTHYVSLVVEKAQASLVSGYLFDGQGNVEYVYGEWVEGYLQLYNQENDRYTVIIMDAIK